MRRNKGRNNQKDRHVVSVRGKFLILSLISLLYAVLTELLLLCILLLLFREFRVFLPSSANVRSPGAMMPNSTAPNFSMSDGMASNSMPSNAMPSNAMPSNSVAFDAMASNSVTSGSMASGPISSGFEMINALAFDILAVGFGRYGMWVVVMLLVVMVGLFAAYFLYLTKPYMEYLKKLSEGIRGFAGGDLTQKIEVQGRDELAMIAESLNSMAQDLQRMMEHDRKVETRKNELMTNVAHDLRTPMTSILGYLELAKGDRITEEQRRKYIVTAYEKAKRLEKLIEDLFEYSKMTMGAVRTEFLEVDVICILRQLLEEFYPGFEKGGLRLDFYSADGQALMLADGNLLARAFANLIGNAIKYGSDGKRVEISLSQTPEEITVRVTNFGEMIPEEALGSIFDRFYRVESSRSTQTGGSGLGLSIAKSIIELHHGTIEAKSSLDGTTFTVILPKDRGELQ